MSFDVVTLPADVLRATAQSVTEVTPDIRKALDDMLDTMYRAEGIGLAANQVGLLHRIIVVDVDQREASRRRPIRLINPEVVAASDETWMCREGCLSIPGQYAEVERPYAVEIKYLDEQGREQKMQGEGLMSSCLQHEIDHLNGVLFIDHLSRLKREMLLKKYNKQMRD